MPEFPPPKACRCGLPRIAYAAIETAGFEMLGRATKMCEVRFGMCPVRRALMKLIHTR